MFRALSEILSKQDAIQLLEIIFLSLSVDGKDSYKELFHKLQNLVSFDYSICGMSTLSMNNEISSYEIVNINYPAEWVEVYISNRYDKIDPIVEENYRSYKLQLWSETYKKNQPPRDFVKTAQDFGLCDGYTLGYQNPISKKGSIFTVSGKKLKKCARMESILKMALPHFHQAYLRMLRGRPENKGIPLTSREVEVLNWLKYGKTSWDISMILNISERTVNYHCNSIIHKLDAVSRSHALAIAVDKGLVEIN